jgi:hypothetical protein
LLSSEDAFQLVPLGSEFLNLSVDFLRLFEVSLLGLLLGMIDEDVDFLLKSINLFDELLFLEGGHFDRS